MKIDFRIIAKIGFLLVIIGFCMPIACDMNGFQLGNVMFDNNDALTGVLFYLVFASALAGLAIGIILLLKKKVPVIYDWIALVVCVACGLIIYFTKLNEGVGLQSGANVILIGWIIALVLQMACAKFSNISVKIVVAIGIGAALMFILMRFVAIPTGIPNTNINFGIAILSVFAAIYGPIAGFFIGLIAHTLVDLSWGWGVWWTWVAGSALFGLAVGYFFKWYKVNDGGFGMKQCITFNIIQVAANLVIWLGIAPTLDIFIYGEPANKVYTQGIVIALANAAVVLILGSLLLFCYSKSIGKSGSLRAE